MPKTATKTDQPTKQLITKIPLDVDKLVKDAQKRQGLTGQEIGENAFVAIAEVERRMQQREKASAPRRGRPANRTK